MVITDQAQFEQLVQEVRDQILSESQGVGEVDIVDNLDNIYSLPALKLNDSGEQVVEAPLSLLSAPAEEAAATANAAAQAANTAAESANNAASSANQAANKAESSISGIDQAVQKAEDSAQKANTATDNANNAADAATQSAQKIDETLSSVLSEEAERVEAENARQTAEAERQSAEEERKSAEEARKLAEQSREQAESSRVSAEGSRVTAESERVTVESNRVQAETERVQKESERESAESTRQQNETTRQSNEDTRNQQEQTRQTNEEQRVSAESSRETEYTDLKQRTDALIDDNEAAIENANTAAENANAAIANMENTYAKKDEIPDVSEFVTTTVDNLVNYYKKSETYTKEEVNGLIGSTSSINFKVVDSLPETGENNLIYLVPSSKQEEKNVKDEYIWVDGSWELIGSTKIDLSNYYTRDEVNSTFALKTELAWDTITGKPVWIGSSKPTYIWSEINEKPTTLAGYGITDAYTKTEVDTRYVKKSGDTMTGTLYFTGGFPQIRTNEDLAGGIRLGKGILGWNITAGTYISGTNTGEGYYANIKSDSLYWNNTSKFWHADNDGSGSGLDADLLDGVHNGNLTANKFYVCDDVTDFNTLTGNGLYGWGNQAKNRPTNYGTVFQFSNVNDPVPGSDRHQVNQFAWSTMDRIFVRQIQNNTWSSWHALAYLTDNVASATKLQTPRTIWGQSFDGTANVSGSMTNVGGIKASGIIKTTTDGAAYYFGVAGHYIGSNVESDFYIWGVGLYDLRIGTNNSERIRVTKNGDVGINTLNPSYKCHVEGTFYASGAATLMSTLTVNGDLTVKGTIIDSTSSDIRLKNILEQVDYQEKLLSLGEVVDFDYNDIAFSRENSSNLEHRSYTGLIYQNVKEILPQMAHEDDDGYGYLNYLSHDYINLIAGALQQTITKQKQLEKRISILEEENISLRQQLSN